MTCNRRHVPHTPAGFLTQTPDTPWTACVPAIGIGAGRVAGRSLAWGAW
jgi:hypothetical protein